MVLKRSQVLKESNTRCDKRIELVEELRMKQVEEWRPHSSKR